MYLTRRLSGWGSNNFSNNATFMIQGLCTGMGLKGCSGTTEGIEVAGGCLITFALPVIGAAAFLARMQELASRLFTGPSLGKPPAVLLGGRNGRGATSLIVRGGPKIVPVTITIVPRLGLCVGALIGGHRELLLGNLHRVQRCSELGRKGVRFVLLLN